MSDWLALFCPEDRDHVQSQFDLARDQHQGFECEARTAAGDRTLILKGQPEFDSAHRPIAVHGVVSDVTDAFATLRALHDHTEMLAMAAGLARLGHWVWSREERTLSYCSDEMARLHGLTPEQFQSRYGSADALAAAVAAPDRDRYCDTVMRCLRDGDAYDIAYALEGADGVCREIRESGRPILEDGRYARFIVTAQDVTEQVLATRELARKTAELEELNRQKDKLFSIIAHDLRNPFNSVLGFADLLAAKSRELSPGKIASYALMVRDAAAGVHELIENLLVWGAYQIRDGALQHIPFDLGAAASEGLAPLMHMAEAKEVRIVNGIGCVQALGDEALVRIVFRNLVSNAIKFSRHGGVVQVTAQRLDTAEGAEPMVRVTVRDDGVGIPASASAALFELGNAFSSPGTRGEKGTGLGLYLCRDIVCRHGGAISVDSAPGAGAAFNFTLPGIR